MNRIFFDTSITGEGLAWAMPTSIIDEASVAKEEAKLNADIKKLFYPETSFMAPGMDRKNSEEDEEEEIESCESSEDEMEGVPDLSGFSR
ncbi:unnamed protein product [Blepharisma stoltei]|uniref:Uncharacterized protein n=1 Tax=Blepharisma stoltei TaxID=1481888 RepID=A0AAU9ISM1_9CILI|nr:unnamed protein product [Blepharisma stoltei]